MTLTAENIIKRYGAAKGKKGTWDNRYQEVFQYLMPDRDNFYNPNNANDNGSRGEDKRIGLYTSTGENSADAFVNRIQSILTPIASNWVGIEVGDYFEKADEKNKELDKMSALINSHKNASNFDSVISEFYYDLCAGTACLLITSGTQKRPLNFKAIALNEFCIEEGKDGEVSYVYRKFKMKKQIAKYQWVELNKMELSEEDITNDTEMDLIECVSKDYEKDTFEYSIVDVEKNKILLTRSYKTNPFVVLRWSKCAGEIYGRGLGMKALHDIQTLNSVTEFSLRALAFSIPTLLAQQDALFDPDDFVLKPGVINTVPSTQTNNPSIVPLQIQPTHDITAYSIETLKQEIKKTMLDSQIPADAGQPKTATEIAQRVQDQGVNISSVFGRLLNEFLVPCTKRMIEVLQDFKLIGPEFKIDALDGYGFKIKINTPLATQQSAGEIQNMIGSIGLLQTFDPTGAVIGKAVKLDEAIPYVLKNRGMPDRFINTPEEIQKNEETRQKNEAAAFEAETNRLIRVAQESKVVPETDE